jgi:hypothetical protein
MDFPEKWTHNLHSSTWWTFLKMWDQMNSAIVP